jgi:hypothetical protein
LLRLRLISLCSSLSFGLGEHRAGASQGLPPSRHQESRRDVWP